jgi:hypothetical protein
MLIAKTNNSNPTIAEIVTGVNDALAEWRAHKLLAEIKERG